jgi:hypothetical protein
MSGAGHRFSNFCFFYIANSAARQWLSNAKAPKLNSPIRNILRQSAESGAR